MAIGVSALPLRGHLLLSDSGDIFGHGDSHRNRNGAIDSGERGGKVIA